MAEDWTPKDNWSPNNHNHDSKYSKLGHTHDDRYSQTSHNHDAAYSKLGHNHDTTYSKVGHTHDYAASNHNHDSVYSKLGHVHDYAAKNHNHDDRYYTESEVNALISSAKGLQYPDYSKGVDWGTISIHSVTQDGWVFAVQRREGSYWNLRVNGIRVFSTGGSSWDVGTCLIPVKAGDVVTSCNGWEEDDNTKSLGVHMIFYPNR